MGVLDDVVTLERDPEKNRSVEIVWLRVGTPTPFFAKCNW